MHFGGYEAGKTHTQRLVITNTSRVSRRIHVVLPSTPFFRAECSAAGSSRRHERTRRRPILPDRTPLLLRLRPRPRRGREPPRPAARLPRDERDGVPLGGGFGLCAVGAEHVARVPCDAKYPSRSSFTPLNATSGPFTVDPKRGVVPANGEVIVTIRFAPTTLRTAVADLVVETSQSSDRRRRRVACEARGFRPSRATARSRRCTRATEATFATWDDWRTGRRAAARRPARRRFARGAARREAIPGAPFDACTEVVTSAGRRFTRAEYAATFALEDGARDTGTDTDEKKGGARAKPPSRAPPPGSGPGPRGRRVRVAATKTGTDDSGARARSTRIPPSESSDSEDCVDGVHVPRRLRGAADVAYVLGQRRGKRRAKDLRRAVAAKDATRVASESTIRSVSNAADVIDAVGREIRRKRLAKVLRGETLGAEERGGGAFEAIREAVRAAAKAAADAVADPSSRSENRAMAVVDDPTLEPEVSASSCSNASSNAWRGTRRPRRGRTAWRWAGNPRGRGNARRWRGEEPRGTTSSTPSRRRTPSRVSPRGKDSSRAQGTTSTKSIGSRTRTESRTMMKMVRRLTSTRRTRGRRAARRWTGSRRLVAGSSFAIAPRDAFAEFER